MRVPLSTILCMLGLCVCFDIVLRVFNIRGLVERAFRAKEPGSVDDEGENPDAKTRKSGTAPPAAS